jgi:ACS family allantoate permease-like MFS transporter
MNFSQCSPLRFINLLLVIPLGLYEVVVLVLLTSLAMRTNQRLLVYHRAYPEHRGCNPMPTTIKAPASVGYYLSGGIPIS